MSDRLEALGRLFADPTGNTAALATAIAIVVLLVLVVVLVLLAFALPGVSQPAAPGEAAEQVRARRSAALRARLVALAIVFVASMAALAVWYQTTSSVRYCTRVCHQMAEPAATWRASAHASVSCTRCHEGRPWLSFGNGVVGRSRSLFLYLTGTEGGRGTVPPALCLDCHEGLLDRRVTALNGETYVHRDDYDAGRTCRECHGEQGHTEPTRR